MRILFYIENLHSGGKERRLVELIKGLVRSAKYSIALVLTREGIHYKEILDLEVGIYYTLRKSKKDPAVFYKFYKIVKDVKPNLIHVWGSMTAFYAIPTKLITGIPIFNNQIADIRERKIILNKITFLFSDAIIANSQAGLNSYNISKRKKSSVIHNGFDFNRVKSLMNPVDVRRKFGIRTEEVVGMVATFYRKKDYKTYIQSAIRVLEKNKEVTFLCVGAGDDFEYKEMVPLKYKENILFLGRQLNVESIMNICDIGILSTFTEGIPNVIMEFMALSKPVVVTDGGGTKELVVNNRTGYLVPERSPKVLAQKIEELLSSKNTRYLFGKAGRIRLEEKFSIDFMINQFEFLYNNNVKY